MRNQNTTKRTRKSLKAQQLKELAFHLAAIMSNPQTPNGLYNAIGEQVTEMSNAIDPDSEQYISMVLAAGRSDLDGVGFTVDAGDVLQSQQIS